MNQRHEPEQFHEVVMLASSQDLRKTNVIESSGNSRIRKASLGTQISAIDELDRNELAARWTKIYDCPPPSGVRRELLAYAIAWTLQTRRLGGLSAEARRMLKQAMTNTAGQMRVSHHPDGDRSSGEITGPVGINATTQLLCDYEHKNCDPSPVNAVQAIGDDTSVDFNPQIINPDCPDHSDDDLNVSIRQPARSLPQPGTRLIREWNGKTNVVDVVQGGFLFEGQSYRSLSAIARIITNTHWSGPRFFGL